MSDGRKKSNKSEKETKKTNGVSSSANTAVASTSTGGPTSSRSKSTVFHSTPAHLKYTLPRYDHRSSSYLRSNSIRPKPQASTTTIGRVSLHISQESLRSRRTKPLRPVVVSRLLSRQIGGLHDPNDSEYFGLVDKTTRNLANYVRSVSLAPQTIQTKRTGASTLPSWKKELVERYAELHDIPLTDLYNDQDIVFRNAGSRYQLSIYRQPRLNWLHKVEEAGEKNLNRARQKFIDTEEEVGGDICCCPFFTAHIFAPAQYLWRKSYKIWTSKTKGRHVQLILKDRKCTTANKHEKENKIDSAKYNSSKCLFSIQILPFGDFSLSPK